MKKSMVFIFTLLVMISMMALPAPVSAQTLQPRRPKPLNGGQQTQRFRAEDLPEGAQLDAKGRAFVSEDLGAASQFSVEAGSADMVSQATAHYGYTKSSTTYKWIDATSGTDLDTWPIYVNLPFTFKYFENYYTTVTVTGSGYLTFKDDPSVYDQSDIPDPNYPNNILQHLNYQLFHHYNN